MIIDDDKGVLDQIRLKLERRQALTSRPHDANDSDHKEGDTSMAQRIAAIKSKINID